MELVKIFLLYDLSYPQSIKTIYSNTYYYLNLNQEKSLYFFYKIHLMPTLNYFYLNL